jgi:hypothetical protein
MNPLPSIPRAVAKKLGNYVYLYVHPQTDEPFYVGKGRNARLLSHARGSEHKRITAIIRRIRSEGLEPRIDILAHSLPSEETAFQIEAAVIDAFGIGNLTNRVRGWRRGDHGRLSVSEAIAKYTGKRVSIREAVLLVRINKLFRPDMAPHELYDVTRSAWVLNARRDSLRYAFAVYDGVVREVYAIAGWLPGGTTFNCRSEGQRRRRPGRWEFVGTIAEDATRRRYLNAFVGHLFKRGNANPIMYVNVR